MAKLKGTAKRMPTQMGDALILRTHESFDIYAVGKVSEDGQQDFREHGHVEYVHDRASAIATATALVVPGRRSFYRDIDTDAWSEISD